MPFPFTLDTADILNLLKSRNPNFLTFCSKDEKIHIRITYMFRSDREFFSYTSLLLGTRDKYTELEITEDRLKYLLEKDIEKGIVRKH